MADTTYTQYGKNVKFGTTELENCEIQSADLNAAKEIKECKNYCGAVVSIVEYNPRVEASISAKMLADTDCAAVEASVKEWLTKVATASPFSLAAGGTTIVSELKIGEKNEDFADLSITATYYPDCKA